MKRLSLAPVAIAMALMFASCGSKDKSALKFSDAQIEQNRAFLEAQKKQEAKELEKQKFLAEKNRVWSEINSDALESYQSIKEIVDHKCSSCHDSSNKLPLYGRIFKPLNPVHKHQVEGLKALDVAKGFPFSAQGNPPTIALLKSIRNAITERSMPIKSYTLVYPRRKITEEDEAKIIDWIDPVIEKLVEFDQKYVPTSKDLAVRANKILELKCYRCHANGNAKGSVGNMQNIPELLKSKYVNLERADQSILYTQIFQGKMPPSKLESLDSDEMKTVSDWLELEAKKAQQVKKP